MRRYGRLKSDAWQSLQKALIPNPASIIKQMIATQEKVLSMCIMLRRKGTRMIKAGGMTPNTIANARTQMLLKASENLLLSIVFASFGLRMEQNSSTEWLSLLKSADSCTI